MGVLQHGHSKRGQRSLTYYVWAAMIQRCTNSSHNRYHQYGGRGITVTKRWLKFENFLADMGEKSPGLTLDRKNNDKGYSKSNCRWVTYKVNRNNQCKPCGITYNGKTRLVAEWAALLCVKPGMLHQRLHRGWSIERTLKQPIGKSRWQ